MYATIFKTKERAEEIIEKIKPITVEGVEYRVTKYKNQ